MLQNKIKQMKELTTVETYSQSEGCRIDNPL